MGNSGGVKRQTKAAAFLGWLTIICLVVTCLEVASYIFLETFASSRVPYLIYRPSELLSRDVYEEYLKMRHPVLGWPSAKDEAPEDARARFVSASAESNGECITAYGDSYVYGAEVPAEDAWSNFLTERIGCRIGNYGVSSYGIGQAFLRFQINKRDTASVTFLGIYPADFKRTVNQYRHFITGNNRLAFKPRYYLDHEALKLAPQPTIDYESLSTFFESPDKFLQHESFLPDSALGPVSVRFPFTWRILNIGLREELHNWIARRPDWIAFVQPDHRSKALEVTIAIASEFMRVCRNREKKCFFVFFPATNEYDYFRRSGNRAIQPLLDELDRRSIPYLDLTRSFHTALGGDDICPMLTQPNKCRGHFNATGNRMVSDHVYEYLADFGLP